MHIPVNPLHRHDLIGLPNIPTRKWGGQVLLHPSGQSPILHSHMGRCVGGTHLNRGTNYRLPCFWPLSMWVSKFAFPYLRSHSPPNKLSEMLGTESLASDNSQTTAGLFLSHGLAMLTWIHYSMSWTCLEWYIPHWCRGDVERKGSYEYGSGGICTFAFGWGESPSPVK